MNRQNRAFPTGVFIDQRYGQSGQCSGHESCKRVALPFLLSFTTMFLLVGFILTMVGNFAKPSWGPDDDWCGPCKEDRLKTERHLKNCRIAGPIFLGIGGLSLIVTIAYICIQRKNNTGQGITRPNTGQAAGSTTQGGSGNVTTTTQYPSPYGFEQPAYGQTPEYPSGSGPYTSTPAEYASYPTVPAYPPSTQYPYNSSQNGPQSLSPTELPPPPSYESIVGQSNCSKCSPGDASLLKRDERMNGQILPLVFLML